MIEHLRQNYLVCSMLWLQFIFPLAMEAQNVRGGKSPALQGQGKYHGYSRCVRSCYRTVLQSSKKAPVICFVSEKNGGAVPPNGTVHGAVVGAGAGTAPGAQRNGKIGWIDPNQDKTGKSNLAGFGLYLWKKHGHF